MKKSNYSEKKDKEEPKSAEEQRKEVFNKEIGEFIKAGETLAGQGRNLTEEGTYIIDLGKKIQRAADFIPPEADWESIITSLQMANEHTKIVSEKINNGLSELSTGSTDFVALTTSTSIGVIQPIKFPTSPEGKIAFADVLKLKSRNQDFEKTISLMKEFNLDKAYQRQKSATNLLTEAYNALKRPVTESIPVSTSLIPLRDCINVMIDRLVKQKPQQEPTGKKSNRIISIGNQLKKENVPIENINLLVEQWRKINNQDLSPSKTESISREDWQQRFSRGILFIQSFLKSLDSSKLRE